MNEVREKVIKALECCAQMSGEYCRKCPYENECNEEIAVGQAHLASDALSVLKNSLPVQLDKLCEWLASFRAELDAITKWLEEMNK